MAAQGITGAWGQLVATAKASPGKAGTLLVLVAVMAVLWARVALTGGPSTTRAAVNPEKTTPAAGVGKLADPAAPPAADPALLDWIRKPIAPVGRNLFSVKLDYFPQDATRAIALREPAGDGFWDLLAKSLTARADQENRRRILIENLRLQAAQLRLESILLGGRLPRALINGKLLSEGDVVAEFRLVKIEAKRIVIEREGIRLEILYR